MKRNTVTFEVHAHCLSSFCDMVLILTFNLILSLSVYFLWTLYTLIMNKVMPIVMKI